MTNLATNEMLHRLRFFYYYYRRSLFDVCVFFVIIQTIINIQEFPKNVSLKGFISFRDDLSDEIEGNI